MGVTCFGAFSFGAVAIVGVGVFAPSVVRADDMPAGQLADADAVLDRYTEATGGQAAYDEVKSANVRSTMEIPSQNIRGSIKLWLAENGDAVMITQIPAFGKNVLGRTGDLMWQTSDVGGPRLIEGEEREMMNRNLSIDPNRNTRDNYPNRTLQGTEMINGEQAYKVELSNEGGQKETRFYSVESGLLLRSDTVVPSQMGEMAMTINFTDYKEYGKLKVPATTTVVMGPMEMKSTIEAFDANVQPPEGTFEVPAEIKQLADSAPAMDANPTTQEK